MTDAIRLNEKLEEKKQIYKRRKKEAYEDGLREEEFARDKYKQQLKFKVRLQGKAKMTFYEKGLYLKYKVEAANDEKK